MNSDGTARWLYVAACLLVPAIWGAGCAWLFGKLDQRRLARLAEQPSSPKTATDDGKR